MAYLNYMDEYTRGWGEHMQDDYEMTHFMSRSKYPESMETYGLYTTNEDKWKPASCSNCYSITRLIEDCPFCIFQSYEHQVVGCPSLQAIREEFMSQANQHKPQSNK